MRRNRPVGAFVRKLEAWRDELDLTNRAFAAQVLGVHESHWSLVRRGLRGVSDDIKARVLAQRPEYQFFLLQDLSALGRQSKRGKVA